MRRSVIIFLVFALAGVSVPTFVRQIHRRFAGVNAQVYLGDRNMERYLEREVRLIVDRMAQQVQKPPKNARIDKTSGEVMPEESGTFVDSELTVERVMNAKSNTQLELETITIIPLLRVEHLEVLVDILGDFVTPLMGAPGRVTNIRLSLAAVNNTLVLPGEIFSFNEVVGERTIERGYKSAPIILGETVTPGVGGGVCQTSSTLYNAVNRASLEIVERRIHSIAPSYIQHGKDATVAWPHTDFKFRNSRETPIIVKGEIQRWRVRVWVVGME